MRYVLVTLLTLAGALQGEEIVDVGSRKQLFLDDYALATVQGAARIWNQPVKYEGNPVLRGDRPWENWVAYPDGGPVVLYDSEDRLFKMWYQSFADDSRTAEYDQRYISALHHVLRDFP